MDDSAAEFRPHLTLTCGSCMTAIRPVSAFEFVARQCPQSWRTTAMHSALRVGPLPISAILGILVHSLPRPEFLTISDLLQMMLDKPFDSSTCRVAGHTSILTDPTTG